MSRDSPCGGALLRECEEEGFNGWGGVRSEEGGGWYLFFLSFCFVFVFVFFLTSLLSLYFLLFFISSFSSFLPSLFLSSVSVLI